MIPRLTPEGYAQTQVKLADLRRRLAALNARTDLGPIHREEVRRSYERMIQQYVREIKLFEAANPMSSPEPTIQPTEPSSR